MMDIPLRTITGPSYRSRILRYLIPHPGTVLTVVLLLLSLLWAQAVGAIPSFAPHAAPLSTNTTIPYQGRLTDADNNPLTGTYDMTFTLYGTSTGADDLWQETWSGAAGVQVLDGFFSVMLGSHSPIPHSLFTQNLAMFLGIRVNEDPELTPRVQLGSVPYALSVADGSVTTAKIATGAVTADKLAQGLTGVPARAIVMWSGLLNEIPTGWQLCDGTNGTPDLRDKFIQSVADGQNPGESGGSNSRTLSVVVYP